MDNLDYIDTYFGGGFSPEEASRFDKRIQEDPAFADEVSWYLGARSSLKESNLEERKSRFRELYREGPGLPKMRKMNPRTWRIVGAAAAVLALVVLSWLLFLRPPDAPMLAGRYIRDNLTVLPIKMGPADRVQAGINLYNAGQFSDASQQFEDLLRVDSVNPAALLDAGIVSLRMENYDKALDFFRKLQNHTDPGVNPALFYEALTLMRRNHPGDTEQARQQLKRIVQEDLNKKEDARELLGKM